MKALQQTPTTLPSGIAEIGPFSIIADGTDIPVLAFEIPADVPYTV